MSRTGRNALLLAPIAVLLAACGAQPSQVSDPPADPAAYPVVAVGQAGSVLDAVQSALLQGVDAKDAVDARLLGPFRELAQAQARIDTARKAKAAKPAEVAPLRLIVPSTRSWPRFFVSVADTSRTATPVLRVLRSPDPRSPYGLWAEATMLPGATLPETAPPGTGSALVAPDADGLVATPKEVLSGFAGYLNAGAESTASGRYRPSTFGDQLQQRLVADRKELKAVATVSSTHRVGSSDPIALRTADGGALVIGELQQEYVVTVKKGKGTVKVSDKDLAALADGKQQFSKKFTRTAVEIVVFNVPPRGKGLITVIAAQKGDVKAVAK